MATTSWNSASPPHSLRLVYATNPATPAHTPQHSLHSSTSSRTPLLSLSLHEYRRRQHTPTSQSTPPGKTLRRKAAACALNELERVPSVSPSPADVFRRPLHLSRSAHQLASSQPQTDRQSPSEALRPTNLLDGSFRSQSAGPPGLGSSHSGHHMPTGAELRASTSKVSNWKPIKRLPKPSPDPVSGRVCPLPISPGAPLLTTANSHGLNQPTSTPPFENPFSSSDYTTPSTFSISRFPQPPYATDPPLSPPIHENAPLQLNTSFTATAPATPPATPAVIHYRGTSFDLVNPHDSLLLHEIETPSKEIDSTDYLPLRTSEEFFAESEAMTQRGRLYGDFSTAFQSIAKRGDQPMTPNLGDPLPPQPAVLTPESLAYSSLDPPSGSNTVSPLAARRGAVDSRFSLKDFAPIRQLTRTFSKKSKSSPGPYQEELQELPSSRRSVLTPATPSFEGNVPHSLLDGYIDDQASPYGHGDFDSRIRESDTQRISQLPSGLSPFPDQRVGSALLTSMVPDEPSTQIGRGEDRRASEYYSTLGDPPYYDQVSLYPSSSIYTGEADEGAGYPPSLYSKRTSDPLGPLSFEEDAYPATYANHLSHGSMYSFASPVRSSYQSSRPLTQEVPSRSQLQSKDKTDTISKLIDQYDESDGEGDQSSASGMPTVQPGRARKVSIRRGPGPPPQASAPLAPAFEYDEEPMATTVPDVSGTLAGGSSYSDTRHLLHISRALPEQPSGKDAQPARPLDPSSSYSQPEIESIPGRDNFEDALNQAQQLFEQLSPQDQANAVPLMWSRSGSGNLLRSRQSAVDDEHEDDQGDWETVDNGSRLGRPSMEESIADYSSTENGQSGSDMEREENSLPALSRQPFERESSLYRHPSPLPEHSHPFSSSPPGLKTFASAGTTPEGKLSRTQTSSSPFLTTIPRLQQDPRGANKELYHGVAERTLFNSPYELSDRETQELLDSGPNEDILYENGTHSFRRSQLANPFIVDTSSQRMERENTFEKLTALGPKGNLTGTPKGAGMREVGSSLADTSSPGASWNSTPADREYRGFYVDPSRTSSFNRIIQHPRPAGVPESVEHERPLSQITLFPRHDFPDSVPVYPSPLSGRPRSIRVPGSISRPKGKERAAVNGQTKLRRMYLASDTITQSTLSGQSISMSQFMESDAGERPSTSNTNTPLRPRPVQLSEVSLRGPVAHEHSPHLLCPERVPSAEDEAERRKKSWIIFGLFFVLPPVIILYRWFGDYAMSTLTQGRLGHCSATPKRIAVSVGVIVNLGCAAAIITPIMIAHASGIV